MTRTGWLAALAVLALAVFVWLAVLVLQGQPFALDASIRSAAHAAASPALTWAMRAITTLGSEIFLVPLAALLLWRWLAAGRRRTALVFVATVLSAELFVQLSKLCFHRARPEVYFGLPPAQTYSYPSGHAFLSAVYYGSMAAILTAGQGARFRKNSIWAIAAALALAVGFSRIYLGFHYPSDVLGGYAGGTVWLILSHYLAKAGRHQPREQ